MLQWYPYNLDAGNPKQQKLAKKLTLGAVNYDYTQLR